MPTYEAVKEQETQKRIAEAVAAEREECAKIADVFNSIQFTTFPDSVKMQGKKEAAAVIATKIRERGQR